MYVLKRNCFESILNAVDKHPCKNFLEVYEFSETLSKSLYVHWDLDKVFNCVKSLLNLVRFYERR